jgi:hypothetical protein
MIRSPQQEAKLEQRNEISAFYWREGKDKLPILGRMGLGAKEFIGSSRENH